MEVVLTHSPAGTSVKTLIHYLQEMKAEGEFQQFDYGSAENLKRYGQKKPPKYPLEHVTAPLHFFYSKNDWLAMPNDVKRLANEMVGQESPRLPSLYEIPFAEWNHADFLWGIDAPKLVYHKVMDAMKKYKLDARENLINKEN